MLNSFVLYCILLFTIHNDLSMHDDLCIVHQTCPQSAVHAGQVKVPPGYHPIDVEKEWGRLHVAILERERLLRIEFKRLGQWQILYVIIEMFIVIKISIVFCSRGV